MKLFLLFFIVLISAAFAVTPAKTASYSLIVFEGSDWCAVCRKFDKEILKDSSVIKYLATNNITLRKVDFPQRKKLSTNEKKTNKTIAEKYQFKGEFPTIVLAADSSYKILNTGKQTPQQFISSLKTALPTLR